MSITGVRLEGWENFISTVSKLGDSVKTKAMRGIIAKNMKPVAKAIKNNTPTRDINAYQGSIKRKRKDGSISTDSMPGNLKKSIGVKTFGKGMEVSGYAGIQKKKNDGWYGFFVERGTKHIAKNPFIQQAAASAIPAAAEMLSKDTTDYIIQNAKKLGLDAK
jgi:HK97 gp10 family phage protein